MKIQLDVPEDVHKQLLILKPIGGFKNLPETANYVLALNIGELVSKESRTLKREILKQKKETKSNTYDKADVDTKNTKKKRGEL